MIKVQCIYAWNSQRTNKNVFKKWSCILSTYKGINIFILNGRNQGITSKSKTETQQGKHQISSVYGTGAQNWITWAPKDLGSFTPPGLLPFSRLGPTLGLQRSMVDLSRSLHFQPPGSPFQHRLCLHSFMRWLLGVSLQGFRPCRSLSGLISFLKSQHQPPWPPSL